MKLTYFLEICIKQWIPLSVMKGFNPIEVYKFATDHGISDEPASASWVPYTPRKKYETFSAVNSRVKRMTHKYGVTFPRSVEVACSLDTKMAKPSGDMHCISKFQTSKWRLII